jgi:DNA polymerase-1
VAKKLYIIDAMALVYRSFFAFGRPLSTSDGFPTSAIFGTAMFMNKLISEDTPDYLAVVTDTSEPTFRHEMYKDYKATRDKMPDDLAKQLPLVTELFAAYGCDVIKKPGFEADDVIGTIAKQFSGKDLNTYIVSGDKDFLQLVDKHIFVYQPKKNNERLIVDIDGVHDKFSCKPEQVIDALALMGDKVDNVPGVPGIGEKSAAKLIGEFGSLEEIYSHIDEISGKKQKENLTNYKDDAFLSRDLVTIKTDVDLTVALGDLKCEPMLALGNEELLEIYKKLEFQQLIQKTEDLLGIGSPAKKQKKKSVKSTPKRNRSYTVEKTLSDDLLAKVAKADEVVFSIAVEKVDFVCGAAKELAICFADGAAHLLPVNSRTLGSLRKLLGHKDLIYVSHGMKRALQLMWNAGLPTPAGMLIDTKICDYLLDPNSNKHELENVAPRIAGLTRQVIEDDDTLVDDEAQNQLLRDAEVTFEVFRMILPRLEEQKLVDVLKDIDMPLVPILAEMEQTGVYIDADFLMSYSSELSKKIEEITKKVYKEAGEEFNLNSTKQLQRILFDEMKVHEQLGVKRLKKTKTGYSTDESVLSQLDAHPIPKLILEYRLVSKLKNTYVDTLPQHIHSETNRLHTTLHQTVAATGRLSSDKPNLQNIPMRTELGRRIRKAFVPQNNKHVILSADYSQVEIRLLAHLADATEIIKAFKDGLDVHTVTAAKIFSITEPEVTPQMRSQAKAVNFGIIYGMGPQRLSQEIGVTMTEAKEFIARYFEVYPGIKTYTQSLIRSARTLGYSETICGRKRPIQGITDSNRAVLARAENIAVNAPIQGSASDLIKLAMIAIGRELKTGKYEARMLLQIHDELMFNVPQKELKDVTALVKEQMEGALETKVPLSVDVHHGKDWLEAH